MRNRHTSSTRLFLFPLLVFCLPLHAHVGQHPSIHDTTAAIRQRLQRELPFDQLAALTPQRIYDFMTPEERAILGAEYITFRVNVPVIVHVIRRASWGDQPFWLKERGFQPSGLRVQVDGNEFDVWSKEFDAGLVGLGVNSLSGGGQHYFVALQPRDPGAPLEVTDLYPDIQQVSVLKVGEKPWVDWDDTIEAASPELEGLTLVSTVADRRSDARLVGVFQITRYPARDEPDQIVLTWSADPRTTQTIQWRTSTKITKGVVAYQKKADFSRFSPRQPLRAEAETTVLETPNVVNDPIVHRHTATLRGLQPGTTYVYSVGDGSEEGWTELREFTTAPDGVKPFSFIYMGDAQNGLDRWGTLARNAFRHRPDAAFYIMAGDLVNRGADRDDWDSLFANAEGIYDRRQLVPAIGNHECQGGHPGLYLQLFDLPDQALPGSEQERYYSIRYSNALVIVLDSNLPPQDQASWLEEQLANSDATWKFVVFHHPVYSSAPNRDNPELRAAWVPIFDRYHVDLVLQGHDHAYLRTYPMKGDQRVASAAEGTIYLISFSGTKMYEQVERDYTEVGMARVPTYQALDIQVSGDRLVYRAYDTDGNLKDQFVIEK